MTVLSSPSSFVWVFLHRLIICHSLWRLSTMKATNCCITRAVVKQFEAFSWSLSSFFLLASLAFSSYFFLSSICMMLYNYSMSSILWQYSVISTVTSPPEGSVLHMSAWVFQVFSFLPESKTMLRLVGDSQFPPDVSMRQQQQPMTHNGYWKSN